MGYSIEYILYEMEWHVFQELYNWILMYVHGYDRNINEDGKEQGGGMAYKLVYDEENQNWIDYVESESEKYTWMPMQNCFWLRKTDGS